MYHASRFLEAGEALDGQRLSGGTFDAGKVAADLPACGAVQRVSATPCSQSSRKRFCSSKPANVRPFKAFSWT
jgi:hypothetical protein